MRFTRLAFCALLLSGAAQANDLLNIYDQAVNNDTTLQASMHQRDAQVEVKPQARSAYLPQIDGGYSFGHDNTTTDTDPPTPCGTTPGVTHCTSSSSSHGLSVSLNQTIFNWQSIQSIRQANDQAAIAETTYRSAQQQLIQRVAQAYFDALFAADSLRSIQANNQALARQLEQAQKRFEVGLSAVTDVQDAQARYDSTVADLISGQQQLDSARDALGVITGSSPARLLTLQEDIPLPAPDPTDINSWIKTARENNLDVISAQLSVDSAKKGISIAEGGHLPTLGLQDTYTDGTQGGRFAAKAKENSIGLQLSVPIFAGGYTQSNVRTATATHLQYQSLLEGTQRTVDKQTRDAYQGVIAGASRVKALKQAVLSNNTALQASETGLEVGVRTAVDVLNAQQLLFQAQTTYYKSRYDYLSAVLTLKATAGRLTVSDLAEIDRLLVADAAPPAPVKPAIDADAPPSSAAPVPAQ